MCYAEPPGDPADLTPSGGPIDFGDVPAGYTRRLDYRIANRGEEDLTLSYAFESDWPEVYSSCSMRSRSIPRAKRWCWPRTTRCG
ncbi:MAG: hypothetical protein AAGJ10_00980 [Bacteroidota bacterium]